MIASFSRNLFLHLNPGKSRISRQLTVSCSNSIQHLLNLLGVRTTDPKTQKKISKNAAQKKIEAVALEEKLFFTDRDKLLAAVDNILKDPWSVPANERPQRATGRFIELTSQLLEHLNARGTRIITFLSGPATIGKGRVATLPKQEFMRKAVDLENNNKQLNKIWQESTEFYNSLAARLAGYEQTLDLFAFSLDQFGLFEMRQMIAQTGGSIYLDEEFRDPRFAETLTRFLTPQPMLQSVTHEDGGTEMVETEERLGTRMRTKVKINLRLSKELRVMGCVGNVRSLKDKPMPAMISKNSIGEGNTLSWNAGSADHDSSYLFILEISERDKSKALTPHRPVYMQFQIQYVDAAGRLILRVLTIERLIIGYSKPQEMLPYLDQLTILATFAKVAALRSYNQDSKIVTRFVDKSLINILRRFRIKGGIPEELNLLPQYFYYLRKSVFVKKFGTSLDEMAYYRLIILKENLDNVLVMIQPQLLQYSLDQAEGQAVSPDSSAMQKDVVLLADSYFHFVIWQGLHIKQWVDAEYHLQPEYENIKFLIEAPEKDVSYTLDERFYLTKTIRCHFDSPNERILKAKLNPDQGQAHGGTLVGEGQWAESGGGAEVTENFVSDEASLGQFMSKLVSFINNR